MNRRESRDRRYAFIAGVLLVLGLAIVQSQPWRAKSATDVETTNRFAPPRDRDYQSEANPSGGEGAGFQQPGGNQDSNYLGCFLDNNAPGKPRDLSGFEWSNGQMTNQQCVSSCRERGFAYAGTQYGSYCFCGNSYGRYGSLSGGEGRKCDMRCGGDGNQICGGSWANSVYSTGQATSRKFVWRRVGTGDCSGRDVGDSNGSTPDDNQAREGYIAVCWDGGAYKNSGRVFCTYKNISPQQCTGGGNLGVMYQAVLKAGATPEPKPSPAKTGAPVCENINGHWFGWSGDNSGANFFINPPDFPINSSTNWAIGGFEVVPSDPSHADRWGKWSCVGTNKYELRNNAGQIFITVTLRDGRLVLDDGRYACRNNADCK